MKACSKATPFFVYTFLVFSAPAVSLGSRVVTSAAGTETDSLRAFLGHKESSADGSQDSDPEKEEYATKIEKGTNTANPNTCEKIYVFNLIGLLLMFIAYCMFCTANPMAVYFFGTAYCFIILSVVVGGIYALHTGLTHDLLAGRAMFDPTSPSFGEKSCVLLTLLSFFLCIQCSVTWCCVGIGMVTSLMIMKKATNERLELLSEEDQAHLNSDEFKEKCAKAFKEADLDGNGKLDLKELQEVVMFDLTEAQKEKVQQEHLFQKAFVACDEDKNEFIDEEEFLHVMRWVQAHSMETMATEQHDHQRDRAATEHFDHQGD